MKSYLVVEKESYHARYELAPVSRIYLYGVYDSLKRAKRGLKDCAKIAEKVYKFGDSNERNIVTRIVDDEELVVIVKHRVIEKDGDVRQESKLISISIEEES